MNKKITILITGIMILTITMTGCQEPTNNQTNSTATPHEEDLRLTSIDLLGGKYKTCILKEEVFLNSIWSDTHRYSIVYQKNNEKYIGFYSAYMKPALEAIKVNTSEDTTVLCWWRYGHMIEGYSERNAITTFPSKTTKDEWIKYLLDDRWIRDFTLKWASNETITDIAKMLTTTNITNNETRELIEKYNISYILVHGGKQCIENYEIMESLEDITESEYVVKIGEDQYQWTDKVNETLLFRMWDGGYYFNENRTQLYLNIPIIYGLELNYISSPYITTPCENTRIYKIL